MEYSCYLPFIEGFGTGAGLIIAIGAQNAFVLKQGLLKNHVFITALFCAFMDAALITAGVGGFGNLLTLNSFLLTFATWGGAAFLIYYGLRSFWAVFSSHSIHTQKTQASPSLKATLLTLSALTFLNPHVYLDTIVLLGTVSAQFPEDSHIYFGLGASFASFLWFFSLCYGARLLGPLFEKPLSWKILDFFIGCTMLAIAGCLLGFS